MKRDLIYLTLLAALFAAAKVMAQNDGATSWQGFTPRTIDVGFTKTVHILFPAPVTYIDIGSMAIIAGKADGAENVVRVKAAVRDFAEETNLTVITEDGGFYTFDARYAENPTTSTIEIAVAESPTAQPASASEPARADEGCVLLREVGRERPATVKRVLSDIYRQNRADVKGIHTRKYGVEVEVRGIYVHNDVIYLHVQIANNSNISFEVDYCRFVVADRKAARRTAQQQRIIEPLRVCNDPSIVRGHQRQRIVFALPRLTLEEDKILLLEIAEKDGARHQYLEISSKELLGAKAL